ncbi:MAG: sodium:proton antiporter [Alistipes sp.]|nr:sodium:proton antiporter [Alistipes sp.]
MKKVISFSLMLMVGLVLSQMLPAQLGEYYNLFREGIGILLGVCLAFIMINVGREFEIDKANVRGYAKDYFVAMFAAAVPWLLIALYYIYVLLPSSMWGDGDVWKETLLLSRYAAPTSAGILFAMLAALSLQKSWIYQKIQVLAIFDDLDTILLMIPLQVAMIGMKWQMGAVLFVVCLLLWIGWKYMSRFDIPQGWKSILSYAILTYGLTLAVYVVTEHFFGVEGSIHIEVLLPAFVVGMVIKNRHVGGKQEERVSTAISLLFMLLVGMSMPLINAGDAQGDTTSVIGSIPMMSYGELAIHVVLVSLLSNIGKLVPMLFYRDHSLTERLALSVGMFTRGEVGAGVIFIALGYNIGGPILLISILTLVLNLILTIGFVYLVKYLALRAEKANK